MLCSVIVTHLCGFWTTCSNAFWHYIRCQEEKDLKNKQTHFKMVADIIDPQRLLLSQNHRCTLKIGTSDYYFSLKFLHLKQVKSIGSLFNGILGLHQNTFLG